MSLTESRRAVIKEYPAEMAGELVAWSDLQLTEENILIAAIAYAKIGNQGASYTYETTEQTSDTPIICNDSITGFDDPVQLYLTANSTQEPQAYSNPWFGTLAGPNSPVNYYDGFREFDRFTNHLEPGHRPYAVEGRWDVGNDAIIDGLKEQLEKLEAMWVYPAIYYNLAAMAADEAMLVDEAMHHQTQLARDEAESYAQTLESIRDEDIEMARSLTVFGKIPPQAIPNSFARSRHKVAKLESGLTKSRDRMPLGHFQPVVGWRPGGRTWPYMDPTADSSRQAFGNELRALNNDDVQPAAYELDREVAELNGRIERAHWVSGRLGKIAADEARSV